MSISAINCTPIKPQASFGKAENDNNESKKTVDFSDVERLYDDARKYDEFAKSSKSGLKRKSFTKTLTSIGVALAATYIGGIFLANRTLNMFPKASGKILNGLKVVGNGLLNKTEQLANNEGHKNIAKVARKANDILAKLKTKAVETIKNEGADSLIQKAAGVAFIAELAPKVVTADGNNDGIADIAQEGINAYKSALDEISVVSDIFKAIT